MKFLKILFILFLLFFSLMQTASAQNVPGYLGKKAFLDYNFISPYPLYAGKGYTNVIHNLRFSYIISRRRQLGMSFETCSLAGRSFNAVGNNSRVFSEISGKAIGVHYDWYDKKSIAPIGRYFRLEAKYIFGNYSDTVDDVFFGNNMEGDFALPYIGFGYGLRRVFGDFIVFNIGGSLGFSGGAGSSNEYRGVIGYVYGIGMHIGVGILLF